MVSQKRIKEQKLFNKVTCPLCGYRKEIRKDYCQEPNGSWISYFRCKDCGFQWD
jgi:predicted RNA-binding Zn-ribbon protein involved in translation (DUF1610 family)